MTRAEWILAAMTSLAPGRDHEATASAIERTVAEHRPLFVDDDAKLKTAALVVAVAFRESSFRADAVGATNDHCLMQIHGRPDLRQDLRACIATGIEMLRESMRVCPSAPLAFYASGPRGCGNARARRISADRMALAKRLLAEVQP